MACYAVLVSVVELLEDIILHDECPYFRHMAKLPVIRSLHEKFSFLEESLRDYVSKGDKAADRVEAQIRGAAYTVQHIIESQISKKTKSNYKFLHVLKKVERKIGQIKGELSVIIGRQRNEILQQNYDGSSRLHPSVQIPVNTTTMVGFDKDLTTIKDQLCGHSLQRQIISIVGTGGIGKTTLARNTFDDALIAEYFDCRAWVTISQEYNAQEVLRNLMKSLEVCESREGEQRDLIFKHLKGRRYLIMLDDIWNTEVWDDVMRIFPKDDNGSRSVLTTRLLDIARYARTSSDFIHQIQFLNEEDSWDLFKRKVFVQNDCPRELDDIGKSIVNKCGGLPLAIVVIAGILSNDKTTRSWEEIETNLSAILSRTNKHLSSMLSFSYNHLPHQLKTCFLYMGIFPEDYRINVSHLIKLWVAEGFLKSTKSKTLEEVGEECLEDLVGRNLVIVTQRRSNGQYKYCVLHDLLRDLCRERAVDECFFHISSDGSNNLNSLRINFYYGHPLEVDDAVHSIHGFRTRFNSDFVGRMHKRLRVLNVNGTGPSFSTDISCMFRLKFLKFGQKIFEEVLRLPPSIFMFRNLHTLILRTYDLIRLPPEIWKLTQLRHLISCGGMIGLPIPEVGDDVPIQKSGSLETLSTVADPRFTNKVIAMISNLRILKIVFLDVESKDKWEYYGVDNLVNLHRLEELRFSFFFFPKTMSLLALPFQRI